MIDVDQMVARLRARHGDDWTPQHLAQAIHDEREPRNHWGMRWMDTYEPAPHGGLQLTPRARLAMRLDRMAHEISISASLARARRAAWWRTRP
ncbi:hypothetical protein [Thermithiobacillus plumbiphilus]|uniref:Uncharacterized protein n=1 Tax=Thermithiobacillus plumbiphilus TaxID=1729899 RepID=A0ABU9D9A3_9PROT